jgi:clan AA aspartic protease
VLKLGYVRVKAKLRNPEKKSLETEMELLVDTGAIYSIVPARVLDELRIERKSTRKMRLADGSIIERHLGIVEVEVKGETAHSNVIFGEEKDASVLGVTSLEELALQVDPITGELRPLELLLLLFG